MEDLTSSDENVTRRSRAGQGIHHILREAILLAEPCASPGAWARQGRDTPGPGRAGSRDKLGPEWAGVRVSRGQDEPGPGSAGAGMLRAAPAGAGGHSRC